MMRFAARQRLVVSGAALGLCLTLLMLGGCRLGGTETIETSSTTARPAFIGVANKIEEVELRFEPGRSVLTTEQHVKLQAFIRAFQTGNIERSRLLLLVASPPGRADHARAALVDVRQALRRAGIDDAAAHVVARPADGPDTVVVASFKALALDIPDCGRWDTDLSRNFRNELPENMGCAVERNAAVMLARPADWTGPKPMSPRDAARRDEVWKQYTRGNSTVAKKDASEKARDD